MSKWVLLLSGGVGDHLPVEMMQRSDVIIKDGDAIKNRFPDTEIETTIDSYLNPPEKPIKAENLKAMMKVKFSFPCNGTKSDKEKVSSLLKEGEIYTISSYRVASWYSSVTLSGYGFEEFNTVHFSEVKE
jgi:hypothetical protein